MDIVVETIKLSFAFLIMKLNACIVNPRQHVKFSSFEEEVYVLKFLKQNIFVAKAYHRCVGDFFYDRGIPLGDPTGLNPCLAPVKPTQSHTEQIWGGFKFKMWGTNTCLMQFQTLLCSFIRTLYVN